MSSDLICSGMELDGRRRLRLRRTAAAVQEGRREGPDHLRRRRALPAQKRVGDGPGSSTQYLLRLRSRSRSMFLLADSEGLCQTHPKLGAGIPQSKPFAIVDY